jgi:20S proteasome alpha/beta subunit
MASTEADLSTYPCLPDLNRKVNEQSVVWDGLKKSGNESAIQAAREAFRAAFEHRKKREEMIAEQLDVLTDRYKGLLKSKGQKIESFIEAYFRTHKDEFVRC